MTPSKDDDPTFFFLILVVVVGFWIASWVAYGLA